MLLLVFTNDLHQQVFSFAEGLQKGNKVYKWEWGYYLILSWIAGLYLTNGILLFIKFRISHCRKKAWIPFGLFVVCLACCILREVFNPLFIKMPETVVFSAVIVCESLIAIGFIPSNTDHAKYFDVADVSAVITNKNFDVELSSKNAPVVNAEQASAAFRNGEIALSKDLTLKCKNITGGEVFWTEDMSVINKINENLAEINAALAKENDLVTAENRIKEQRSKIEEQNNLYKEIFNISVPYLKKIGKYLSKAKNDEEEDDALRYAVVYGVLLKRRSNLTLMEKQGKISLSELFYSLRESALGHEKEHHEKKDPTCTEIGWNAYDTCTRCDYTTYKEITALGHDKVHHEKKDPTCTEIGWNAYDTCSRCDYTTYEEKSALGHDEVNHSAVEPTCTEKGNKAYVTCTRCDYTTYEEITALGHDKVHHEKKDPTCTEIGWNAYDTCTRCEYATYEEKSALGHSEVKDNAKMPTCAESGLTEGKHCSVCNTVLERQQTVPALGHDFETDFSVDKEPTVTEKGSKSKHCSRCGEKAEVTEIPMLEKKLVNPEATDGENDVVVEKEDGFDRETKLVVETITGGYSKYSDVPGLSAEKVKLAYNVVLVKGGLTVEPDEMITIYLRIPSSAGKEFTLFALCGNVATETEYTIDGDYAVITTDKLAEYVFVTNDDATAKNAFNPLWLILIIGIILAIVAIFVVIIYKKRKLNK